MVPDHESALRRMISDAHNLRYEALHSLDEAKAVADGVVVLEGDDGGQIYVVCPARIVNCDSEVLTDLLRDIDAIEWPHNDEKSARVFFERHPVGEGIAGGMGGGVIGKEPWVHPRLEALGLGNGIRAVLSGAQRKLAP